MLRAKINRSNGWLVSVFEYLTELWMHYFVIWSWAGIFHNKKTDPNSSKVLIVQNNIRHDACWLVFTVASIVYLICFSTLRHRMIAPTVLAIFAICSWRLIDHFVNALRATVFGVKNDPNLPEHMTYQRAQRRLVLILLYLVEVIFLYGVFYWVLQENFGVKFRDSLSEPVHGLQLSFSTLSTIGYGTYAPNDGVSTTAAIFELFTGLLYISGAVAQMVSMLKTSDIKSEFSISINDEEKQTEMWEWERRKILPPVITMITIFAIFLVACFGASEIERGTVTLGTIWLLLILGMLALFTLLIIKACKIYGHDFDEGR